MMASSSIVDGLKIVHLLYGPATEVLKQLLANQLHRKYFKDNEKTIKPKLKVSEVRKIYPFDNKNEESLLQTLDRDCLETLLQMIGIPYNHRDDTKTIHDLITVNLLQKHLDKHERKLKGLNEKKKVLNKVQWANLFPVTHKKWTNSFDITLLCFILFESFDVKPTNMNNRPPADNDTELGDDVERIRYYRNTVIHGYFLENENFSFQWESICCVIIRRGGSRYRDKIEDIQSKDLDPYLKQSYEELIKECQLQETVRCKTVEKLEKDIEDAKYDIKATIHTSATQVQKVMEFETQEVKKEVQKADSEIRKKITEEALKMKEEVHEADSKIREKITEQVSEMKKVMGEHQKEYSSTVNSTLQSYEHKATETMDKAIQKYTDLVSEKIKQTQQTGANCDVDISTILSSVQEEIKPVIQKEMKEMTDNVRLNESDSLRIVMKDFHSLLQNMNDYIETNRTLDQRLGDNVTSRLLQVGVKCDEVANKIETFEKTHQQDKRESSEHDKEVRKQLNEMNGDFQGLAREMTTTSTDIKSIKVAMEDLQKQIRGVGEQCNEVAQKHIKQVREEMKEDFQGVASKMITSTDITSMKDAMEDTQKQMRGVGKQCDEVALKLDTFEETHQQDSSEHDKEIRKQLDQMNGDLQGLAREMTTTSTDVKSMKVAMDDMQKEMRGGRLNSTEEMKRKQRLCVLLVDGGSQALRYTISRIVLGLMNVDGQTHAQLQLCENDKNLLYPAGLVLSSLDGLTQAGLNMVWTKALQQSPVTSATAQNMKDMIYDYLVSDGLDLQLKNNKQRVQELNNEKRLLSKEQWDILYPRLNATVDLESFDMTLLCFVILHVFQFKPTSGIWSQDPPAGDVGVGDDILRLRTWRNKLAPSSSSGIDNSTFKTAWTEIRDILLRLKPGQEFSDKIQHLHDCQVDPGNAAKNDQLIEDWISHDTQLGKVESDMSQMQECLTETRKDGVQRKIEVVNELKMKTSDYLKRSEETWCKKKKLIEAGHGDPYLRVVSKKANRPMEPLFLELGLKQNEIIYQCLSVWLNKAGNGRTVYDLYHALKKTKYKTIFEETYY